MKKAISLFLAFSLVFCLFACNKEPLSETISTSEKEVVESLTELITTLVTPSYAPSLSQIRLRRMNRQQSSVVLKQKSLHRLLHIALQISE